MPVGHINITLGTAGHIDHGKTALVKCLTGCDTDTLKIEKERGMSIELGFAPCTISDTEIGIVDVPGHENFVKTMVAGATGIDGVIFVIAADDGIMPQTREHLDILTLLGIKHGIVALTKKDCIDPTRLQMVIHEIKDFLQETFLERAPILPLSNITGDGFGDFLDALKQMVGGISPKKTDGVFRIPVERCFSVKGYGTVVSGIPVSGKAQIGDEVVILPQGTKGRIKTIQVYKRKSNSVLSGQCAAINVPQWDYKTIKRGNVVTLCDYFSPQLWYLCKLHLLSHNKFNIKTGTEVKFHTGTSEVVATVYLLEGNNLTAGQESLIQVKLSEPVVAGPTDRFILRSLSPVQTVAGGMIIEAIPDKLKRSKPAVLQDALTRADAVPDEKDFVEYCIKTAKTYAIDENHISYRAKILPEILKKILSKLISDFKVFNLPPKLYIHKDTIISVQQQMLDMVSGFHSTQPQSPGIAIEHFYRESHFPRDVAEGVVGLLLAQGKLVKRNDCLALPNHRQTFATGEQELMGKIESLYRDRPFNPPLASEIAELVKAAPDNVEKIIRILIEQKCLVRVENDLYFHRQAIEHARQILTSCIVKEGKLESVKFKYLLDTTRKFAIPLLDYFDRIGLTRRINNTRYLRTPV